MEESRPNGQESNHVISTNNPVARFLESASESSIILRNPHTHLLFPRRVYGQLSSEVMGTYYSLEALLAKRKWFREAQEDFQTQ